MSRLHVKSAADLLAVELLLADGDDCLIHFPRRAAGAADNCAALLIKTRGLYGLA